MIHWCNFSILSWGYSHALGLRRLINNTRIYTMGCPPVRGDNPRALASGLSYVQADNMV